MLKDWFHIFIFLSFLFYIYVCMYFNVFLEKKQTKNKFLLECLFKIWYIHHYIHIWRTFPLNFLFTYGQIEAFSNQTKPKRINSISIPIMNLKRKEKWHLFIKIVVPRLISIYFLFFTYPQYSCAYKRMYNM